jgi:hypothetical protein
MRDLLTRFLQEDTMRSIFTEKVPETSASERATTAFERIETYLASSPVVLFMKGSPDFPQCGFSAQVVSSLHTCRYSSGSRAPSGTQDLFTVADVPAALHRGRAGGRLRHRDGDAPERGTVTAATGSNGCTWGIDRHRLTLGFRMLDSLTRFSEGRAHPRYGAEAVLPRASFNLP